MIRTGMPGTAGKKCGCTYEMATGKSIERCEQHKDDNEGQEKPGKSFGIVYLIMLGIAVLLVIVKATDVIPTYFTP